MNKRKALSKKLRFEVFKRDKFTCQYCGKSAPDVILEVDHINPVAEGGDNDIMNLITSCRDCNRGKGKTKISDDATVKKQQAQLQELAERKEQLEMMLAWRDGLKELDNDCIEAVCYAFEGLTDFEVSVKGKQNVRKWLKTYTLEEVLDAVDTSVDAYFDGSKQSAEKAFAKIGGICYCRRNREDEPYLYYTNYTVKAVRNNGWTNNEKKLDALRTFVYENVADDEDFETLKDCMKSAKSWEDFIGFLRDCFFHDVEE